MILLRRKSQEMFLVKGNADNNNGIVEIWEYTDVVCKLDRMKKLQRINSNRFSYKTFENDEFEGVVYYDCVFHKCSFINVTWKNCQFKNTYILANSTLTDCKFIDSKFIGQHTNLGGPTRYLDCEFRNVKFKNNQFWETEFENCVFSGHAENIVFYGSTAPKDWRTVFKNVDLSEMILESVDFRCEFDLSTTKLKPAHNVVSN